MWKPSIDRYHIRLHSQIYDFKEMVFMDIGFSSAGQSTWVLSSQHRSESRGLSHLVCLMGQTKPALDSKVSSAGVRYS